VRCPRRGGGVPVGCTRSTRGCCLCTQLLYMLDASPFYLPSLQILSLRGAGTLQPGGAQPGAHPGTSSKQYCVTVFVHTTT